jgi:hypothetical protein
VFDGAPLGVFAIENAFEPDGQGRHAHLNEVPGVIDDFGQRRSNDNQLALFGQEALLFAIHVRGIIQVSGEKLAKPGNAVRGPDLQVRHHLQFRRLLPFLKPTDNIQGPETPCDSFLLQSCS